MSTAHHFLNVQDVGLDEPATPANTTSAPGPEWLRVLLWQQAAPLAQVWVTTQAEQQPFGAAWVGAAGPPAPGDSGIRVVTDPVFGRLHADDVCGTGPSHPDPGTKPSPPPPGPAAAPGVVVGPETVGALAAGGLALLSGADPCSLVDRFVLAGLHGLLRVLRTDTGLVRELVSAFQRRGVATQVVAMTPEQFAARHGFKRRAAYEFIQQGLPTQGEGRRRRVLVADGDAWMAQRSAAHIEQHAREAAAAQARLLSRGNEKGRG